MLLAVLTDGTGADTPCVWRGGEYVNHPLVGYAPSRAILGESWMTLQSDLEARLTLTSFLGEVIVNHDLRAEFSRDPVASARNYGVTLSPQQEQIVLVVAQDLVAASNAMEQQLSSRGLQPTGPVQTACICASLNCTVLY